MIIVQFNGEILYIWYFIENKEIPYRENVWIQKYFPSTNIRLNLKIIRLDSTNYQRLISNN